MQLPNLKAPLLIQNGYNNVVSNAAALYQDDTPLMLNKNSHFNLPDIGMQAHDNTSLPLNNAYINTTVSMNRFRDTLSKKALPQLATGKNTQ